MLGHWNFCLPIFLKETDNLFDYKEENLAMNTNACNTMRNANEASRYYWA